MSATSGVVVDAGTRAVFSLGNLFRLTERKVESSCIHCNKCVEICPTDVFDLNPAGRTPIIARKDDCSTCSLKPKCTTAVVRKVTRDVHEDVRDYVRALAKTDGFEQSRRERKKGEMRFAHKKRILKLDRFRLRGLHGVRDQVLLTATAQNF